ncbi:hypothetical protein L249_8650 [Ophiocordyceps polyrhachis-furcata BCC 54312]|uniref:Uncharacterized protein n=1 Tax=Ophiocordyceps polyrhachis-furcata BCC 54312 TaxID=1330021 RepID=A0A367L6Y6_9HYPO|nr:hypothetical protein L249_8650 [Ophiocordyceps polyrhachis-furcata BCC 54312]
MFFRNFILTFAVLGTAPISLATVVPMLLPADRVSRDPGASGMSWQGNGRSSNANPFHSTSGSDDKDDEEYAKAYDVLPVQGYQEDHEELEEDKNTPNKLFGRQTYTCYTSSRRGMNCNMSQCLGSTYCRLKMDGACVWVGGPATHRPIACRSCYCAKGRNH